MQNVGKIFEQAIKSSVPDYCLLVRLPDPPHAFTQRSDTRFSIKNPCDYICYDSKSKMIYFWELKTTAYKSISFEDVNSDEIKNKMIHKHQIEGLTNFSKFDGVCAGFFFNFRDEEHDMERTYFQNIKDFNKMCKEINKKSFNEIDALLYGAIKIQGKKKRTRYTWDIDSFLKSQYD